MFKPYDKYVRKKQNESLYSLISLSVPLSEDRW